MFSKKNKKRAFTLIEMLIVIVIIGVLAAALIPRLSSARGRANDVARKSDLSQTAAAIVAYQIDRGTFPSERGSIDCISGVLISAGMNSIPTDPDASRTISGFTSPSPSGCTKSGNYYYFPVPKNGIPNGGFVLVSATQTEGGSNFSMKPGPINMENVTYEEITARICKTFTEGGTDSCGYDQDQDDLRYIYIY